MVQAVALPLPSCETREGVKPNIAPISRTDRPRCRRSWTTARDWRGFVDRPLSGCVELLDFLDLAACGRIEVVVEGDLELGCRNVGEQLSRVCDHRRDLIETPGLGEQPVDLGNVHRPPVSGSDRVCCDLHFFPSRASVIPSSLRIALAVNSEICTCRATTVRRPPTTTLV